MPYKKPPPNPDLYYSLTLSAAGFGQLIGCTSRHVHDCLVDQHGQSIKTAGGWEKVDHDTTEVWFEWPDGIRVRAHRNRNGDLMFLTGDALDAFGAHGRQLHPSVIR